MHNCKGPILMATSQRPAQALVNVHSIEQCAKGLIGTKSGGCDDKLIIMSSSSHITHLIYFKQFYQLQKQMMK